MEQNVLQIFCKNLCSFFCSLFCSLYFAIKSRLLVVRVYEVAIHVYIVEIGYFDLLFYGSLYSVGWSAIEL